MQNFPEVASFGCIRVFQQDIPDCVPGDLHIPYRGDYLATFDILHAVGRVMLIKVTLLLGPYGNTLQNVGLEIVIVCGG